MDNYVIDYRTPLAIDKSMDIKAGNKREALRMFYDNYVETYGGSRDIANMAIKWVQKER